jgi:hypothetical protein
MTLTELKRNLNAGMTPAKLPGSQRISKGAQRMAYRVGAYVVKLNTHCFDLNRRQAQVRRNSSQRYWRLRKRVPKKALAKVGVLAPATWYAGPQKCWVIQRYYEPIMDVKTDEPMESLGHRIRKHLEKLDSMEWDAISWEVAPGFIVSLDLHIYNLCLHPKRKRLVAIDW